MTRRDQYRKYRQATKAHKAQCSECRGRKRLCKAGYLVGIQAAGSDPENAGAPTEVEAS